MPEAPTGTIEKHFSERLNRTASGSYESRVLAARTKLMATF